MKRVLVKNLLDLFRPKNTFDIDVYEVLEGLGDGIVRKAWLFDILSEVKAINLEIDKIISSGKELNPIILTDLSGRRRALQFVLEAALSAKRDIQRSRGHNPAAKGELDLDSVTLRPGL